MVLYFNTEHKLPVSSGYILKTRPRNTNVSTPEGGETFAKTLKCSQKVGKKQTKLGFMKDKASGSNFKSAAATEMCLTPVLNTRRFE